MRSSTKIILWGAAAATLAAGAYCIYQNKDKFIKQEDVLNEDGTVARQRTYVSIDPQDAKEAAVSTYNKAKESVQRTFTKTRGAAPQAKSKGYSDLFDEEEYTEADFALDDDVSDDDDIEKDPEGDNEGLEDE